MSGREHESITVGPLGVFGICVQEVAEEDVGHGCATHGETRVTGVGLQGGGEKNKKRVRMIDAERCGVNCSCDKVHLR